MATATMGTGTLDGAKPIPMIRGLDAARAYLRFVKNPLDSLMAATRRYGSAVGFDFTFRRFVLLREPAMAEHVLVKNWRNYSKNTWGYEQMRLVLGDGLVTSQGDFWMRQRRIAQPAFHRKRIAGFVETMAETAEKLGDDWAVRAGRGDVVDVASEMMSVTLDVVTRTLLGVELHSDMKSIGDAVSTGLKFLARRMRVRLPIPVSWPTPANIRFKRGMAELDGIVYDIIAERRRTGEDAGDLLSMFMFTRDEETGETMSDAQLRDEVMTMFLAGHETTAMNLTWMLYLLAQHPEIEEALRAELRSVLGESPRRVTMEDLKRFDLLPRVVKESLRLYPPVPIVARMAEGPDEVGGYALPQGSYTLVSPYVTHRHPRYWPNPERFDPDRFLPELERARPKFAYIPFSGGRRKCIGDQFAVVEAQVILATLLPRFRLSLRPGQRVQVHPTITLRPKGGLPMRLEAL